MEVELDFLVFFEVNLGIRGDWVLLSRFCRRLWFVGCLRRCSRLFGQSTFATSTKTPSRISASSPGQ